MDKGSDDLAAVKKEADALYNAGMYRKALPKFKSALAMAEKAGDEQAATALYTSVITCHDRLEEVSGMDCERIAEADVSSFSQPAEVLRLCDQVEPLVRRVRGSESEGMALLMRRRAEAFRALKRFTEARLAALQGMKILEQLPGRGTCYIYGLLTLVDILRDEGDFEGGLEHIVEARSLLPSDEDSAQLANVLNTHAILLVKVGRFQEALEIILKHMALSLRLNGPNHPDYASCCFNAAGLYAKLNQMHEAIDLMEKALAIYMKTFGPSHPSTQLARNNLADYQKALTDPAMKKHFVKTRHRMCSIDDCHSIEEGMNRCMSCGTHYLCKKHEGKINEHVPVCPKFADLLPDEKKGRTIVKCRRCRKETKLMKCSVCESVWYCGATCQKEDWKRHKLFCGKK